MIFTAMPVLNLAVFNVYPGVEAHMRYPALYSISKRSFNFSRLLFYQFMALFQSVLIYFVFSQIFGMNKSSDGHDRDLWVSSTGMYICLVCTVTFEVLICTDYFTLWSIVWIILSLLSVFIFTAIYSALSVTPDLIGVFALVMNNADYWLWLLILVVACNVPEFALLYFQRQVFPRLEDVVLEKERMKGIEAQPVSLELPTLRSSPKLRSSGDEFL